MGRNYFACIDVVFFRVFYSWDYFKCFKPQLVGKHRVKRLFSLCFCGTHRFFPEDFVRPVVRKRILHPSAIHIEAVSVMKCTLVDRLKDLHRRLRYFALSDPFPGSDPARNKKRSQPRQWVDCWAFLHKFVFFSMLSLRNWSMRTRATTAYESSLRHNRSSSSGRMFAFVSASSSATDASQWCGHRSGVAKMWLGGESNHRPVGHGSGPQRWGTYLLLRAAWIVRYRLRTAKVINYIL